MAGSRRIARIAVAALMVACAAGEPGIDVPPPPPTEVREVVDTLHGVEIPDPYRWLEDQEAPETRAWIDAQNAHTDTVLGTLPGREELRAVAASVLERDVVGLPNERGGRYFYSKRRADQDLAVVYVREGLDGEDRVLIDPHPMSPDHTTSVELRDISDDGKRVVYGVREGGVDEVTIKVRDVDTGEDLADVLPPARYGEVTLAADGGGLYYEQYGNVTPRVMHHAFGTPMADDVQLFGEGYERYQIPVTVVSDDGRWMVVHVIEGSSGPTAIHVKDLQRDTPFVTAIADGVSESWAGFAGGELFIVTNLDAPNKRVVLADPADPGFERWREVIPEREDVVVETAAALGGRLAVSYLQEVQPRVAIHELDGTHVRDIAFDTVGSVGGGAGRWTSDEAFFTFQTFHVPSTIYRYDIETGEQSVWAAPESSVDAAAYEVTQRRFTSKDGTEVPMFVAHRPDLVLDGRNPTLLTGYGGFNNSMTPAFSALGDDVAGVGRRFRPGEHARRRRVRRGVAPGRHAREQAERLRRLHSGGRASDRGRLHQQRAPGDPRRQQRRPARRRRVEPAARSVRGGRLHLSAARHGPLPPVPRRQLLGAGVRVERGSATSSPTSTPTRRTTTSSTAATIRRRCISPATATPAWRRCTRAR